MVNQQTITTNNMVLFYSYYDGLTMVNQSIVIATNNIVFFLQLLWWINNGKSINYNHQSTIVICYLQFLECDAPKISKLVNITPISLWLMVQYL